MCGNNEDNFRIAHSEVVNPLISKVPNALIKLPKNDRWHIERTTAFVIDFGRRSFFRAPPPALGPYPPRILLLLEHRSTYNLVARVRMIWRTSVPNH